MTDGRRKWPVIGIWGLLLADWFVSFSVIGGPNAGTIFLVSFFLGIVAFGFFFLTKEELEEAGDSDDPNIC